VDPAVVSRTAAAFLANAQARLDALDTLLAHATTPADVAWTLCGFAGKELDLADAVVYLRDPCGTTLTQQAAWGPKRAASRVLESRLTLAVGQGIVGRCARLRLPQRTGDARFDPRYVPDDQANLSELAVPIQFGDAFHGVLDSEHPAPDFYSLDHEHALQAIADRGARRLEALAAAGRP
jgi:putative methionine-R-sulfoxide reductase with GAF domain